MNMNTWSGIGNLGSDPILRESSSGVPVCNFSVAIDGRPNSTGEKRVDWIPVTTWGPLAENCAKYLQKGSQVGVTGQLRQRAYTDADGVRHNSFEVRGDQVQWLKGIKSNDDIAASVVTTPPVVA